MPARTRLNGAFFYSGACDKLNKNELKLTLSTFIPNVFAILKYWINLFRW